MSGDRARHSAEQRQLRQHDIDEAADNEVRAHVMFKLSRTLIAKSEQYEVTYFARKHRITAAEAREITQKAGRSRAKANDLAEALKKR